MFERLLIKNFQCHERLDLKLDPHVSTLVGPSDVGKSAVLRALRWLCANTPTGDSFVRQDAVAGDVRRVPGDARANASVHLRIDGRTAKRTRGSATNEYYLDGTAFKSFGTGVPADIRDLLQVSELNFAGQLDPPFWFCDTAGKVQRELNAIVDLGVIDDALGTVAAELRQTRAEVSVCETRLKEAETEVQELAWVPAYAQRVVELEAKRNLYNNTAASAAQLAQLVTGVANAEKTQRQAANATQRATAVLALGEKAARAGERVWELGELVRSIRDATTAAYTEVPDLGELEELRDAVVRVEDQRGRLVELIGNTRHWEAECAQLDIDIRGAAKELKEQTGGKCPYCQNPIK